MEGQIGAKPAPMHHRDDPAVDTAVPAIKFRNSEILHNFIIIHRTWVKSDHFRQITNRTNIKNLFDSFLANLKVVVSYLLFEMFLVDLLSMRPIMTISKGLPNTVETVKS